MKKSFRLENILNDYSPINKSDKMLDGDMVIDNSMITIMYQLFEEKNINSQSGLDELKISLDSPSRMSKLFKLIPQKILKRFFLDFFGIGITMDSGPEFEKIKRESDKVLSGIANPLEYLNKLADFVMNYTLDYSDILNYVGYVTPLNKILKDKKADCLINSIIGYKLTALYRNDVNIGIAFGFYSDGSASERSGSLNLDPFFRLPLSETADAWLEAEINGHKYIIDPRFKSSAITADPVYPKEFRRLGNLLILRENKYEGVKSLRTGTAVKPIYS